MLEGGDIQNSTKTRRGVLLLTIPASILCTCRTFSRLEHAVQDRVLHFGLANGHH